MYERIRCSYDRMFFNARMLKFIARIGEIYEWIRQSNARMFFNCADAEVYCSDRRNLGADTVFECSRVL